MIGIDIVSLADAEPRVYDAVLEKIVDSPDRDLWYGSAQTWKVARSSARADGLSALLFASVGLLLVIDALGDTESAWNAWNVFFFAVMMMFLLAGFTAALGMAGISDNAAAGWKRHRFIVQIGERNLIPIGVADIWQDAANETCVLDCSLLPDYRGRKLGSVATRMMIRKCFTELGAWRVESSTVSTNIASIKMNDRMIEEGVVRGRWMIRGARCDEHIYRLLKPEWEAQLAGRVAKS
jgi:RimJ/RimL family protein N-acetyltransferase